MKKKIITIISTLIILGMLIYGINLYNNKDINEWLDITVNTDIPPTYEEYVTDYKDEKLTEQEFIEFVELEENMTFMEQSTAFVECQLLGGEQSIYYDYINTYDNYEDYSDNYMNYLSYESYYNDLKEK